jgi:hypothetical protein
LRRRWFFSGLLYWWSRLGFLIRRSGFRLAGGKIFRWLLGN